MMTYAMQFGEFCAATVRTVGAFTLLRRPVADGISSPSSAAASAALLARRRPSFGENRPSSASFLGPSLEFEFENQLFDGLAIPAIDHFFNVSLLFLSEMGSLGL